MQESLRETGAALSEGKFGQRQGLIEGRQVRLERDIKQAGRRLHDLRLVQWGAANNVARGLGGGV